MSLEGVSFEFLSGTDLLKVYSKIDQENMDIVLLEKKPNIAIYTPQTSSRGMMQ